MQHLPMAASLQKKTSYQFYESGHMVYAHEASLKTLHDSVAGFIHQHRQRQVAVTRITARRSAARRREQRSWWSLTMPTACMNA